MIKHLLFSAAVASLAVTSACAGPDCSTGVYQGNVEVEGDTVYNFITAQVREPLGSAFDRELFRGCDEIAGALILSEPSAYEALDDIGSVGTLITPRGDESDQDWTIPGKCVS